MIRRLAMPEDLASSALSRALRDEEEAERRRDPEYWKPRRATSGDLPCRLGFPRREPHRLPSALHLSSLRSLSDLPDIIIRGFRESLSDFVNLLDDRVRRHAGYSSANSNGVHMTGVFNGLPRSKVPILPTDFAEEAHFQPEHLPNGGDRQVTVTIREGGPSHRFIDATRTWLS